jgi:hypothetical protein
MHTLFENKAWTRRAATLALSGGVFALGLTPALAHHGWAWADGEQITLQGTVESVSMAPPHPSLKVKVDGGGVWLVDLGNPSQTARSGFTGEQAKPGDAITVLGNRHKEHERLHIKAVRITVGGTNYDMYPERIRN